MKKIILASASPRRIEMLQKAGCDPVVMPASIIEELPCPMSAEDATVYLARQKASAVMSQIINERQTLNESPALNSIARTSDSTAQSECIIIAADTVVVSDGQIIGKPADRKQAYEILCRLRGRSHQVITGCCLIHLPEKSSGTSHHIDSFYESTEVFFKSYTDEELIDYISTDEPYDKAGGYAIQGSFGKYVDHIEGDYDNVVGLPLSRVLDKIR